jgi:hypothetical protein
MGSGCCRSAQKQFLEINNFGMQMRTFPNPNIVHINARLHTAQEMKR